MLRFNGERLWLFPGLKKLQGPPKNSFGSSSLSKISSGGFAYFCRKSEEFQKCIIFLSFMKNILLEYLTGNHSILKYLGISNIDKNVV